MASWMSSPPTSPQQSSDDTGVLPASSPNTSTSTSASLNQVHTHLVQHATEKKQELKEPSLAQSRRVAETISAPFVPFDAEAAIVKPFQEETNRDTVFDREFTSMLLDIMLEFHAWSAARPRGESEYSGQLIEQRIGKVMSIEMEQEDTRRRLSDFIKQVKLALDALTGIQL